MDGELYFCLHLTEGEHYIVCDNINTQCNTLGLKLIYYRELKEGHVPMLREIKIKGNKTSIKRLKKWMREEKLDLHIQENPYSKARRYLKSGKTVKSFSDAGSSVLRVLNLAERSLKGV